MKLAALFVFALSAVLVAAQDDDVGDSSSGTDFTLPPDFVPYDTGDDGGQDYYPPDPNTGANDPTAYPPDYPTGDIPTGGDTSSNVPVGSDTSNIPDTSGGGVVNDPSNGGNPSSFPTTTLPNGSEIQPVGQTSPTTTSNATLSTASSAAQPAFVHNFIAGLGFTGSLIAFLL